MKEENRSKKGSSKDKSRLSDAQIKQEIKKLETEHLKAKKESMILLNR